MKRMKYFFMVCFCCILGVLNAQPVSELQQQAADIEKKLDEVLALEAYKKILKVDSKNLTALVKCAEYCASIGARQKNAQAKLPWYTQAQAYASQALDAHPEDAQSNYVMALSAGKLTETEDENKKVVEYVRQVKVYGDKALALNPNYAKANYVMGKWHYQMITLSWIKRTAVKAFYGGLPEAELDSAIKYMERCRSLDKYFALNYLDLAKAYNENREPAKALAILNLLVKLPIRTYDDTAIKEEGRKLLEKLS